MSNQIKVEVSAIDKTKGVMKSIRDDFSKLSGNLKKGLGSAMGSIGNGVKGVGSKISGILSNAIGGITTGLIGIGTAGAIGVGGLIADAVQADKTFRDLQNQIGATKGEMDLLKDSVKTIFGSGLGNSLEEVSKMFGIIKRETKLTGKPLEDLTKQVLVIGDTFGQDYNKVFFAVNRLMSEFGMTGKDATDIVMKGFQSTGDIADDFLDTVGQYAANFKSAGYEGKEFLNYLINANKQGVKDFDETGDIGREFFDKLVAGGADYIAMLDQLGINYKTFRDSVNNGSLSQKDAMLQVAVGVGTVGKELDEKAIAIALFGERMVDVGTGVVKSFKDSKDIIGNFAGTTDKAMATVEGNIENVFRKLRVSLMKIGEAFLPHLEQLAKWISDNQPMVDAFAESIANYIKGFDFTFVKEGLMFLWENLKTVAKVAKEVGDQLFKRFTDNKPAIEKFGESVANFIKEFDFDTVKDSLNVVWEILKAIATTVEFVGDKIGKVVGAAGRVNERYNITEGISGFFGGFGLKGFTDVGASQIEETRNYKENLLNPATNKGGTININMNNNVIKDQADEKRTAQTISETIAKQNQSFINGIK